MSSLLMMVDEDCLQSWLNRRQHEVQSKMATLESRKEDWFESIRSQGEIGEFDRRGNVAVINVFGALDYRYDFWAWLFNSSCYIGLINQVNAAVNDPGITKIVLWIDSPGGGFHGQVECANAIYAARQSKEVVAVVDPEAASAGYWLASQATRIVCLESGWVGSIGSQTSITSYSRMMAEAGIDKELIRASISPNKNLGWPYEPISDKARAERQRWADFAGDLFLKHIERGRGKSRQEILDKFGQGTLYFAEEAKERGLVDSIGGIADEIATATQSSSSVQSAKAVRSESVKLSAVDLL